RSRQHCHGDAILGASAGAADHRRCATDPADPLFQQGAWDLRIRLAGIFSAARLSHLPLSRRMERPQRPSLEGAPADCRSEARPWRAVALRGRDRSRLGAERRHRQRSRRAQVAEDRSRDIRQRVARGGELDSPGRAAVTVFLIVVALLLSARPLHAETAAERDPRIKLLVDQQRWTDVVREVERIPDRDADLDYYYGTALAQLNRWDDARHAFFAGRQLAPTDSRFPVELGGVAFKQKRYAEAAKWVRRGLQLNPTDAYGNDFLAT